MASEVIIIEGRPEPPLGLAQASQATAAPAAVAVSDGSDTATAAGSDIAVPSEAPSDEELDQVQLDASKLHVYQIALELHTLCSMLVASLNRIVRDQLERASLSVILNTAEAAGRHSRRQKAYFYTVARGSATEVAALLDVLDRRRLAPVSMIRSGRRLAIRIIQMLTKMDQRLRS